MQHIRIGASNFHISERNRHVVGLDVFHKLNINKYAKFFAVQLSPDIMK